MVKEVIWNSQEKSENTENDLELNTDIVHNRFKTYNSLSDLYGIQLFTDQRTEEIKQYTQKQERKEKDIKENIFVNQSESKEKEDSLVEELFSERMVIVMNQDYEREMKQEQSLFLAGGIIIFLFFGIIWGRYFKKRKNQKIEEESSYE